MPESNRNNKGIRPVERFPYAGLKGIVDRDRRTEGEIAYLREQHIYVPNVAEVENLLMLEPVIKTVAARLMKDPEQVFNQVKENVIKLFLKDLESQVLLHARHRVQKKLETALNRKMSTVDELTEHVESIRDTVHVDEIYTGIKEKSSSLPKPEITKISFASTIRKGCCLNPSFANTVGSVIKRVI